MQKDYRVYIYAFLSRIYSDVADKKLIEDLKKNSELLELIGEETTSWLHETPIQEILEGLNIDYTSMFDLNTQPIESFVLDAKSEALVGLQNPVMGFYFSHGFEVMMDQTSIMAPDHLSIELAFMQTLVFRDELEGQEEFLRQHLLVWVIPYMIGMRSMATTPFYRELCDFINEFLVSDYDMLHEAS